MIISKHVCLCDGCNKKLTVYHNTAESLGLDVVSRMQEVARKRGDGVWTVGDKHYCKDCNEKLAPKPAFTSMTAHEQAMVLPFAPVHRRAKRMR